MIADDNVIPAMGDVDFGRVGLLVLPGEPLQPFRQAAERQLPVFRNGRFRQQLLEPGLWMNQGRAIQRFAEFLPLFRRQSEACLVSHDLFGPDASTRFCSVTGMTMLFVVYSQCTPAILRYHG